MGIWEIRLEPGTMHLDERACKHFGFSANTVALNQILERVHPDDVDRVRNEFISTTSPQSGDWVSTEFRVIYLDASVHWLAITARIWFEGKGIARHAIGQFGTSMEITARKRGEEELRLFKTVVEATKEAIAISDSVGKLVYINPAHEKLFGYSLEQAQTRTYRDYHSADLVESLDRQVFAAIAHGESWTGEMEVFDRAGRKFSIWERAGAVMDKEGKVAYGFGLIHDITKRKQAEEALRASEEKYRSLVESSEGYILVIDANERIIFVNERHARSVECEPSQLIGKPLRQVNFSSDTEEELAKIHTVIERNEPLLYEEFNRATHQWYRVSIQPVRDGAGKAIMAMLNVVDISPLKQA